MKIVIVNDLTLLQERVARLVEKHGHEVIMTTDTVHDLMADIDDRFDDTSELPNLVITDVCMPPEMSDDGLRMTVESCGRYPQLNVTVLSQYMVSACTHELFSPSGAGGSVGAGIGADSNGSSSSGGAGYLLRDRVGQVLDFSDSFEVIAGDGMVIDLDVATVLVQSGESGLANLTMREREVLKLTVRGKSDKQIADSLVLSGVVVARYASNIFMRLYLEPGEENRHVRAILELPMATSGQVQGRQQSHPSQR